MNYLHEFQGPQAERTVNPHCPPIMSQQKTMQNLKYLKGPGKST